MAWQEHGRTIPLPDESALWRLRCLSSCEVHLIGFQTTSLGTVLQNRADAYVQDCRIR